MKIDNIILPATVTDGEAIKIAAKRCGMPIADVKHFRILKKSVDARNKNDIKYVYNIVSIPPTLFRANISALSSKP